MPKRSLFEQLDEAVQGIVGRPNAAQPRLDKRVSALARLAGELRQLPRQSFKTSLKSELERKTSMATLAEPVATMRQSATPYLCLKDAAGAIEFYKKAFGAKEVMRLTGPGEKIGHAEITIGGSVIMLSDEFPDYGALSPESLGGSAVKINLNVDDVDAVAKRALSLGAKMVRPVEDQFYGERSGQIADPFGYTWIISTTIEVMSPEEMQKRFEGIMREEPAAQAEASIPRGFRTLTPYPVARDAAALIDFVKQTFGAEEKFRAIGSAGGIHAEIQIGDSMLMMGGGGPGLSWHGDPIPMAFHLYVPDCDATYDRALRAGATSIDQPVDQFYGERSASVQEAQGNFWYIATFKGRNYKWEGAPDIQPYLHPLRAEPVINFLKRAFGAVELGRHATPEGVIHHATLKIGNSYLEMGEAQGKYQPMPSMFYLYVPDCDAVYRRAIQAGATSIAEPADQPYGDRSAGVKDAFGNQWYIGTHIKGLEP